MSTDGNPTNPQPPRQPDGLLLHTDLSLSRSRIGPASPHPRGHVATANPGTQRKSSIGGTANSSGIPSSPPPAPPPTPVVPSHPAIHDAPLPPLGLSGSASAVGRNTTGGMRGSAGRCPPQTSMSPGVPSILARVGAFLPQLAAANQELDQQRAAADVRGGSVLIGLDTEQASGDYTGKNVQGPADHIGTAAVSGVASLQIDADMVKCTENGGDGSSDSSSTSSSSSDKDSNEAMHGSIHSGPPTVEMNIALGDFEDNPMMSYLATGTADDGEANDDDKMDEDGGGGQLSADGVVRDLLSGAVVASSSSLPSTPRRDPEHARSGNDKDDGSNKKKRKVLIEEIR